MIKIILLEYTYLHSYLLTRKKVTMIYNFISYIYKVYIIFIYTL